MRTHDSRRYVWPLRVLTSFCDSLLFGLTFKAGDGHLTIVKATMPTAKAIAVGLWHVEVSFLPDHKLPAGPRTARRVIRPE